jgi:ATP-binding cassette, subfamily B, bacterial
MTPSIRHSLTLLRRYLAPEWKRALLLLIVLFTAIGLQLLQPQVLRDFLDLAMGERQTTVMGGLTSLTATAVLFITIALSRQLFTAAATYVTQDVRWRTTNELRADLAQHALRLDMGYHNSHTAGEMIARVDEDVNNLSNFFSQFIIQVLGNGLLILGVILVLFREDWRIGLGFVGFVLVTGQVLSWLFKLAVPHFKAFFEMAAILFSFIEERLAGLEDIKANGGRDYTILQFHQTLRNQYVIEQKTFAVAMLTWATTSGFFRAGTALGLGLGGYLYQLDIVTIGTVYLIIDYSAMLQQPLRQLTQQLQELQRAVAGAARIQELYFTETNIHDPVDSPDRLPAGPLAVEFDRVSFHYVPDNPVLRDVSLRLEPGQVLGLLGRTGSGKTTMTRLLFRLYEPVDGAVCVGEQPVATFPLTHLRRKIGMVTQEVQLFNATIRDNLTFFNPDIADERILQALADLELMPWYEALPHGLETVLETGGRGLSAGEAQLLAFTRVFLQDPGLVIMDEASSRLDPATEYMIERAIDNLLTNRSAIIVAHRLATVQRADDILILENGRILEYGPRLQLTANPQSHFAQLLRTGMEEVLV